MSFSLGFLAGLSIQEIIANVPRLAKKDSNPAPTFMGFRVHKDGSVFPSEALVQKFNLEYPKATVTNKPLFNSEDGSPLKDEEGNPVTKRVVDTPDGSNGFDVFMLHNWTQAENRLAMPNVILVAVSPKKSDKVDLFSNSKYNDDGTPKTSVLDQGAVTFGKDALLPMLKDVYGVEIGEEGFLDLEVMVSDNVRSISPSGIFNLPKLVTRGEKKGKADFVRRENVDIFPLVVPGRNTESGVTSTENAPIEVPVETAFPAVV